MGEVYRARDPRLGRDVAIKVLPAEVAADPHRLRRAARARGLLALALRIADRWDEAAPINEALEREAPSDVDNAGALRILAAHRGQRSEALRVSEGLRRLQRDYLMGEHTLMRARIAAWLGEKDQAVDLLRAAFAQGVPHDIELHRDLDLSPLRGYPPFEELIRPR